MPLQIDSPVVDSRTVSRSPADIDAALQDLTGRRLVIDSDLAGLRLVLTRMMRQGILDLVETAVLPREPIPYLSRLGMPDTRAEQWQRALVGRSRLVGVIKDDSGGLCVDSARLGPWDPNARGGWWLRAVVDDQRLCDGAARTLSVTRLGPDELEATVQIGRFAKRTMRGRSLQLACDEAMIIEDGVARARPRSKRTFWSEPQLWRLCL